MKEKRNKVRIQLNDQGLSLVELLVAIIILAIIVVPFLNSFVVSSRANSKAALTHRATIIAQNIMEGFKTDDLGKVIRQFSYPEKGFSIISKDFLTDSTAGSIYEATVTIGADGENEYIKSVLAQEIMDANPHDEPDEIKEKFLNMNGVGGTVRRSSIFSEDDGDNYEFISQEDGKYCFVIKGIQLQGRGFDAMIQVDSSRYRDGGLLSDDLKYNNKKTVRLNGTDTNKDAIFVQKTDMDEAALHNLKLTNPTYTVTEDNVKREIIITVRNGGSADKPIHQVKVKYVYTFLENNTVYGDDKEYLIFDNTETGENLRSIYLYYLPWYSAHMGTSSTDTITVNNEGLPIEIFVIKQEKGETSDLKDNEMNYTMTLDIKNSAGGVAHKSLKTNLEDNLAAAYLPEGVYLPPPHIVYRLNGAIETDKSVLKLADEIVDKQAEDRIYDILISVYEEGAADAQFKEETRLAQLAGGRND